MERVDVLLRFCKALADESRLRIVGLLAGAEHSVQQLAARLMLREPTVSHHLSVLKELGLVALRIDGNVHWYRLNQETLTRISRQAFSRQTLATLAAGAQESGWQRKILGNFVEGERLKEIPVSRRKRWVVLKWLAACFKPGATYTEAQVNALLKLHHEDAATLRRELVGYRMLARNKGLYRRLPESEWRGPDK
jgi:biotin operon repressor